MAHATETPWIQNPHGQVQLISSYSTAPTSGDIYLGLHFKTIPGWHLYWKDSGDAGFPPRADWKGSSGFTNPQWLWPTPHKYLLPGDLLAIGYEGEVVYPVKIHITPHARSLHAVVDLHYLTCKESCVPYHYTLTLDIPTGTPQQDVTNSALIQTYVQTAGGQPLEPPISEHTADTPKTTSSARMSTIVLLAFLGGLILNVMPCVLPVLSIKLLGFFRQGGGQRSYVTQGALASAAGIEASFLGLAILAILAKRAGQAVGWGIQFQEPGFVAILAVIVFLFALNLWGVFEINMPRLFGRFATNIGQHESLTAHFMSGLFATLLATPCSAPFLGTAMGFALSQSGHIILTIFLAAGTGMALPYFTLAFFLGSIAWLPKPGAWMVQVRMVMGFLLALTLVWLNYVLANQVDAAGLAFFNAALVAIAFVAWVRETVLMHHQGQSTIGTKGLSLLILIFTLGSVVWIKRHCQIAPSLCQTVSHISGETMWTPFQEDHIQGYLNQGKPVFVDVSAEWCFTCKFNEKTALRDTSVVQAFQKKNVILMKADWTNRNKEIGDYLARNGRYGIPFYAYYEPGKPVVVLPEILTASHVLRVLGVSQ